jgi:hypothetical protein
MEIEDSIMHLISKVYRTVFNRHTLKKIIAPKVLVSIFIAGIMILSTLGVILDYQTGNSNKMEYNGYKFEQMYDGVQTKINGQKYTLTYFPQQLEYINMSRGIKQILEKTEVFTITYDPESEYKDLFAAQQFNLGERLPLMDKYVIPGVANNTGIEQIPQITCRNATPALPVIMFKEGITTNMTLKNNCITINIGNLNDADQIGDLLFYQIAGVMQ